MRARSLELFIPFVCIVVYTSSILQDCRIVRNTSIFFADCIIKTAGISPLCEVSSKKIPGIIHLLEK